MTSTAVSSQGTKLAKNTGTTQAPVWSAIKNMSNLNGFAGSASDIDVTDFDSTAKEYRQGLQDWDTVSFDININMKEASHAALLADKKTGVIASYQATLSDGTTIEFEAYVKSFPITSAVDNVVKGTVVIKITGDIEVTPAAA
ncbi:phage tail tube protein [Paraburkholderia bannensis]|uniref:phage tail tube protein n=1 Tax=Paraburkholderia bannensis TaxID=765414 RepID=UPI00048480B2|nr:phage tail tube protein [Paraburkholderia bannensis]